MNEIKDKMALLFNHLEHQDDTEGAKMAEEILALLDVTGRSEQLVCKCGKIKRNYGASYSCKRTDCDMPIAN